MAREEKDVAEPRRIVSPGSTGLGPGLHLSFPVMPTTPEPNIQVNVQFYFVS